ncbi:MAG: ribbon-helix-helix domain-containing protein [Desulfobacteraceae bacterium]|jgi:metal-responsive CopG/Arc/MetJ family transcriptional regulator|nr:MAG: ribbon-helix-helix domain-containing protein [Desulfobacteraceae bacterium]
MVRKQVYLTKEQHEELKAISKALRKRQSELIRDAVDHLIEQSRDKRSDMALRDAAGIWKDRKDLPDFETIRSDWDRQ